MREHFKFFFFVPSLRQDIRTPFLKTERLWYSTLMFLFRRKNSKNKGGAVNKAVDKWKKSQLYKKHHQ